MLEVGGGWSLMCDNRLMILESLNFGALLFSFDEDLVAKVPVIQTEQ